MNSRRIEEDDARDTRYLIRDLLLSEAMSHEEITAALGCSKNSISANLARLRQEGYTVEVIGNKPPAIGKRGVGSAIYSIDSKPPGPKVGSFSLSALWGSSKEMT